MISGFSKESMINSLKFFQYLSKLVKMKFWPSISKIFIYSLFLISFACENNIEVIKNFNQLKESPMASAKETEILYSDSGIVRLRITAPIINRYSNNEKEYTEFPKGIKVEQFDNNLGVSAIIQANYAIYYEKQNLWVARDNVVAKNLKRNEELDSEEIFWDETKGIIYSHKYSRIINDDGVFNGEGGFEAKEDLSQWHMLGIQGKVNIKEDFNE
jgi:LPS export ABC transporter protein LptC